MIIYHNYGHVVKKLSSVIVSQKHYLNKILDVHPLTESTTNIESTESTESSGSTESTENTESTDRAES